MQVAPRDTGRYILQYKLYEAQDVGIKERIGVLEEFKRHEYVEKWAFELAYLYHRAGMSDKCIAECDEIILWFSEGKYVEKAMELKMLYRFQMVRRALHGFHSAGILLINLMKSLCLAITKMVA